MASINREPNGRRTIQFMAADGKRKSIRLGTVNQKVAESIRVKVEALLAFALAKNSWDEETAKWVGEISDGLASKLAAVGLIPAREGQHRTGITLGEFIGQYSEGRTDVKCSTQATYRAAKTRLLQFFGTDRPLHKITAGDADDWLVSLRSEEYAPATIAKFLKRARQFFKAALRKGFAKVNPFADSRMPSQANPTRNFFITPEMARKIIDACPDHEWRLIFALARYGGLRCPSEHLSLQWCDVDWERGRFLVRAPKKEHLEDGGERWVPIFPELRPHLEEAFERADEGAVHVITRYRCGNQKLRTQLNRIVRRAGLKPWPRLFQNLRATRETELAELFPLHVVCEWIGNSVKVASAHYLQVTDDHFQRAVEGGAKSGAVSMQNPVQQPAALIGNESQAQAETGQSPGFMPEDAIRCKSLRDKCLGRAGLEPAPLAGQASKTCMSASSITGPSVRNCSSGGGRRISIPAPRPLESGQSIR